MAEPPEGEIRPGKGGRKRKDKTPGLRPEPHQGSALDPPGSQPPGPRFKRHLIPIATLY